MAQYFVDALASTIQVVFGPVASTVLQREDTARPPLAMDAGNSRAMEEPINTANHLYIVVHGSTPLLPDLHRLDLARYSAMRTLKVEVVYDTVDSTHIVDVWRSILGVLRSITDATALERLTLTSPAPLASLRSGWSRSILVAELQQPLYSIDHYLVRVVDRAPLSHITLVAPWGETFISTDWARVIRFFPALYDYDMLNF